MQENTVSQQQTSARFPQTHQGIIGCGVRPGQGLDSGGRKECEMLRPGMPFHDLARTQQSHKTLEQAGSGCFFRYRSQTRKWIEIGHRIAQCGEHHRSLGVHQDSLQRVIDCGIEPGRDRQTLFQNHQRRSGILLPLFLQARPEGSATVFLV